MEPMNLLINPSQEIQILDQVLESLDEIQAILWAQTSLGKYWRETAFPLALRCAARLL